MHKLMQLKEELIEELESYAGEEKTVEHAMHIKCLASAADHLCNICKDADEEEASSQRSMAQRSYRSGRSYDDGMRRSYDDGMSGQPRDGRGRYDVERGRAWGFSGDDDTVKKLEKLAERSDESTRRAINQAIQMMRG